MVLYEGNGNPANCDNCVHSSPAKDKEGKVVCRLMPRTKAIARLIPDEQDKSARAVLYGWVLPEMGKWEHCGQHPRIAAGHARFKEPPQEGEIRRRDTASSGWRNRPWFRINKELDDG